MFSMTLETSCIRWAVSRQQGGLGRSCAVAGIDKEQQHGHVHIKRSIVQENLPNTMPAGCTLQARTATATAC